MNLRRSIGYTAIGLGSLVGINRWLQNSASALEPPLAGSHDVYRWRGMDIAYTEAGDPENQTVVLLHGINAAGSSGEFREIFDDLAEEYHVVAPDLPGFGCSDRPPLRYSAALYEDFVTEFLTEYDEPAVVASSLTSAYATTAATETPVSSLFLICPTTIAGPEPPKEWLLTLVRSPIVGEALFNLIASKPSIRYFNDDHGYYDASKAGEEWQAYEWRTAHQPNARYAPASFISGYLNSDIDLAETLSTLSIPVTMVWGREADITPLSDGRELAEETDARLVVFDRTMLLPHVEFPEEFLSVATEELPE